MPGWRVSDAISEAMHVLKGPLTKEVVDHAWGRLSYELEAGYDIRTMQKPMGHKDGKRTMV